MRLPGEQLRFLDFKIFGFHPLLVLQIVPTGKPSPLTGCQIVNKTLTSLKVQCQEGEILFLATLVALHFTPVSESLAGWLAGQSFRLA